MSKWTPGPWKACNDGNCPCRQVWSIPGDVPVFTARDEKSSHIGLAHHKWGDGPDMIYGEIPLSETQANARLISRAPEMAKLLEAFLQLAVITGNGNFTPLTDRTQKLLSEINDAR